MGYTHYLSRKKVIPLSAMRLIAGDFKKLLPELEKAGCRLAGWDGTGEPRITDEEIAFNGPRDCGHPRNAELSIPWPSPDAGGVARPGEDARNGQWHAGATIRKRMCNGSCSYETFRLARTLRPEAWERPDDNGLYFTFCKTAFRPYDLAVICVCIIAKHHLKSAAKVKSDGTDEQWFDGKLFCQMHLGYGLNYRVVEDGRLLEEVAEDVASAGGGGR
ncbi:MAG TPA: hypothetical protein PK280_11295 [Planctomycetota bacterium]|nr:hypothetical protein [Planctomycetota bacterium]